VRTKAFGGCVGKLAQLARAHGSTLEDLWSPRDTCARPAPPSKGGQIPGLVVEYFRNAAQTQYAKSWVGASVVDAF
jgi:hypothetical protein